MTGIAPWALQHKPGALCNDHLFGKPARGYWFARNPDRGV